MSWNYRVVHTESGYHLAEVYYNDEGNPDGFYCDGALSDWEGSDDLKKAYNKMKSAFKKPVLECKYGVFEENK